MNVSLIAVLAILAVTPCVAAAQDAKSGAVGPMDPTGETFIAVKVRDDSVASVWYSRIFSLREARHLAANDDRYSIRILSGPNLTVELLRLGDTEKAPASHFGFFKVGYHVADIEASYTWLAQNDVDRDPKIFDDETLPVRTFVFRDPEGNRFQLFQTTEH